MVKVSVVIPSRNRAFLLTQTLNSLVKQEINKDEFEVLIVDHGSTDGTKAIAPEFQGKLNISYIYREYDKPSISIPKNAGWKLSSGDIVCFLDSGMLVPCFYVDAHKKFHEINSRRSLLNSVGLGLCYGQYREDSDWLPQNILNVRVFDPENNWLCDSTVQDPRCLVDFGVLTDAWVYCWGGNISLYRRLLEKADGFDEQLSGWGFEDLELGYRLHLLGAKFSIADQGWAIHLPHDRDPLSERINHAFLNWRFSFQKHPTVSMEAFGAANLDIEMHKIAKADILSASSLHEDFPNSDRELRAITEILKRKTSENTLIIGARNEWLNVLDLKESLSLTLISDQWQKLSPKTRAYFVLGIQLPLPSDSVGLCIISTIWQFLNRSPRADLPPYLRLLVRDAVRTSERVIFLYDPNMQQSRVDELVAVIMTEDKSHKISICSL